MIHALYFIESGNLSLVKAIIDQYPELIETKSISAWTPIMFACRYGYKDIVEFLHKQGALVEFERGYCCSHLACYGADVDTLKYLFEVAKVSPNPES